MPTPVSTTTEHDDLIGRFLSAAEVRVNNDYGLGPLNSREAAAAISWLRGLVGKINEDGSVV